ncbi:MAG: hypothetical protein JWP80_2379 [Pseudomonas sp.]|nr:hypothetical protein [Pseudomonas sp.]
MPADKKWSIRPIRKTEDDPTKSLLTTLRIASRCKYQAAGRLKRLSMFSFYATTLLSLGLIAIPLIIGSHVASPFPDPVLTMVQIFLAVAVLVFSAVIGTARYEVRAYLLDKCGHQLKDLARRLDTPPAIIPDEELATFVSEYFELTKNTENHLPVDYRAAMFSMPETFPFNGPFAIIYWTYTLLLFSLPYVVPLLFIVCEFCFICDMVWQTHLIPAALRTHP